MLKEGKLQFEKELPYSVTWHDPCELGRYQGIYRPARDVLSSIPGLKLYEMKYNKDQARCCGGGGLLKATNPEMSIRIGAQRIKMAAETGADIICSECPSCAMSMDETIELSGADIKYKDLSEIVVEALGLD
jgi:glycolate oxidase